MDNAIPDWLNVSRETLDKLNHYLAEVVRWNATINLVSKTSIQDIWNRHLLDSAQLYPLGNPQSKWVDIGSGGGFPGLVLAIMGVQDMVLVESDQRKATFLRQMARQLSLPVTVLSKRTDHIVPQGAKTLSARALASLTHLFDHAKPHLDADGVAIFPKGRGVEAELSEAETLWRFDVERHQSKTDSAATILVIRNIQKR